MDYQPVLLEMMQNIFPFLDRASKQAIRGASTSLRAETDRYITVLDCPADTTKTIVRMLRLLDGLVGLRSITLRSKEAAVAVFGEDGSNAVHNGGPRLEEVSIKLWKVRRVVWCAPLACAYSSELACSSTQVLS
jgi:hypothetical protein